MIAELLESVGVNPGTWLFLFVIAWYLFRGAQAGRRATSVLGRAVTYSVLILVSFGAAAALGYADLSPGAFLADVHAAGSWLLDEGIARVESVVSGVFGG
ncbi:hypothetical protein HSRCO_0753 [Halanaeroarchaeum sp. HSR-CO]|uniref:hypothetical protein n=1 Tax=Halanaeroarchaeum sp. HSR-CO TaxID=2866382 RepID=UPI00217EC45A|nr:hypothetical protein [Halanaeroarchaeum sp. HSR-CO]UWG47047.1 hypothetical protein HSRCO_0753 [Halanaeroarchaeum sp. HSR-CO]